MCSKLSVAIATPMIMASASTFSASGDLEKNSDMRKGWGGYVQFILGANKTTSLTAVGDNNKINSLNQKADSVTELFPGLLGEINYTFANESTQVYLGTPTLPLTDVDSLMELGIKHTLDDGTLLKAAYVPSVKGISSEVWQDPFLIGQERKETDVDSDGFTLAAEYIFDTPLSITYGYATQKIDNEQSGLSLIDNPDYKLSVDELHLLKRDAKFNYIDVKATLPLTENLLVIPTIQYIKADADGEANSLNRSGLGVRTIYFTDNYDATVNFSYDSSKYEVNNPVFDIKRKDKIFAADAGIGFNEPFGWKSTRLDYIINYSKRESNISFYDEEAFTVLVGITYNF